MPVTHCPHLGLSEDPSLHLSYPDDTHRCFASSEPTEIELQHQSRFCLTEEHPACPRYVTPPEPVRHEPTPLEGEPATEAADEAVAPPRPWWRLALWGTALVLLALVVWRYGSTLVSLDETSPTQAPAPLVVSHSPTPTSTPRPIPAPTPAATEAITRRALALPMADPTPWPGGRIFTLQPSAGAVGWVASNETRGNHFGDSFMHCGYHDGVIFHSALQFDLSYIPPGAPIMYAELRLTGLDAQRLGVGGSWELRMLEAEVDLGWQSHSYQDIHNAREEQTLSPVLGSSDLGQGETNVFIFDSAQRAVLEQRVLEGGHVSFRLDGPQTEPSNVFTWDSGYGPASRGNGPILFVSTGPVPPTPTATNTPIPIVVTSTPTPENVLTAAAMVATATAQATMIGTATPPPPNLATPTPVIVVTNTPTPKNAATATAISAYVTAVAMTTGTFTPMPPNVVTATATPTVVVVTATPTSQNVMTALAMAITEATRAAREGTATPLPSNWVVPTVVENAATATAVSARAMIVALTRRAHTPTPAHMITVTPTPTTPLLIYLDELTPTPTSTATPPLSSFAIPAVLKGKIAFLSDRGGGGAVYVMEPDGSRVALLTSRWPYDVALQRESFSPDGDNERVFVENDQQGIPQLFISTSGQDTPQQLTAGESMSYDPAWSPRGDLIAFVSQNPGNDEIFIIQSDGSGRKRLTVNDWEWDKHPTWSPDATRIAFWSNMETGRRQIWVMNADGSKRRNVSKNPYNDWDPVWIR